MPPANEIFPPLAAGFHQQHRLRRQLVALYKIIVDATTALLPTVRKLQRCKIRIRTTRSILAVQLCRPIKLPLRSYNILQLRHCLQLPSRYMRRSLQHVIVLNAYYSILSNVPLHIKNKLFWKFGN